MSLLTHWPIPSFSFAGDVADVLFAFDAVSFRSVLSLILCAIRFREFNHFSGFPGSDSFAVCLPFADGKNSDQVGKSLLKIFCALAVGLLGAFDALPGSTAVRLGNCYDGQWSI